MESTLKAIIESFGGNKAELVVCDGAPDVTGFHDIDIFVQAQLLLAAINISIHLLEPNGNFVAKIFRGKDMTLLTSQLKVFFKDVHIIKPHSSRLSSTEAFVIGMDFQKPTCYKDINFSDFMKETEFAVQEAIGNLEEGDQDGKQNLQEMIPYLMCGDLSGFDD